MMVFSRMVVIKIKWLELRYILEVILVEFVGLSVGGERGIKDVF